MINSYKLVAGRKLLSVLLRYRRSFGVSAGQRLIFIDIYIYHTCELSENKNGSKSGQTVQLRRYL